MKSAPDSSEALDLLGMYFRDLSGIDVMSKEEELAASERIARLRTSYWRALLGYADWQRSIVTLASELLPAETRPAALPRLLRLLRGRTKTTAATLEAALAEAAEAIAAADVDGVVSDRVLADLIGADAGRPVMSLSAALPSVGDPEFARYAAACRRAHHALVTAKQAFVRANLRLVIAIARRFARGQMPLQDLIQEGNLGLIKAVDRFDPSRGFRFSTYGTWWIRHTITRALADKSRTVRLPVHLCDTASRTARASREFEKLHGRSPTDDELVALTGVSADRLARLRRTWVETPVSLDEPLSDHEGLTLVDAIEDRDMPEPGVELDAERLRAGLEEVMSLLGPMEAEILRLRIGDDEAPGQTLHQIGERYALSRERIRQLQEKALVKLRGGMRRLALIE